MRRLGLQITQQSCRNQLLARLSADDFALLGRHLEPVDLAPHQVVFEPQTAIRYAYFLESGIASVIGGLVTAVGGLTLAFSGLGLVAVVAAPA